MDRRGKFWERLKRREEEKDLKFFPFLISLFKLEPYMDEEFLTKGLALMGETGVLSIKVIKNKFTGEPASYGFVNFDSDPAALMAMHKLNGKIIPNSQPVSRPVLFF